MPWLADYVLQKAHVMKYCRHSHERCSGSVNWACSDSWSSSRFCRRSAKGQTWCQVSVRGLTPVFSLVLLHRSSSVLFSLIKSDNIWRAREDRFNVANITAGVILAILAVCCLVQHFKLFKLHPRQPSNTIIQSFKPSL